MILRALNYFYSGGKDDMEFPECPVCKNGHLLPLTGGGVAITLWVCSSPKCAYVVSGGQTAQVFFKGTAVMQEKEKGGKKWTEFSF